MLEAVAAADPAPLLDTLLAQQDAGHLGHTAPFLSSHDLTRLPATVPDPAARRMLEVVELLLPGDPVLYYGEELDLADATTDTGQDYAWRAPMAWDHTRNGGFTPITAWFTPDPGYLTGRDVADQEADPQSPLRLIEDLACVRDELADADWEPVETDTESVFAFSRGTDEGRVVVVANLGGAPTGPVRVDRHGGFRDLTDGGAQVLAEDGLALQGLGAWEYRVFADTVAARCTVAPAS
jgi:glycosidase